MKRSEHRARHKIRMALYSEYRGADGLDHQDAKDADRELEVIWPQIKDVYAERQDKGLWLEREIKSGRIFELAEGMDS